MNNLNKETQITSNVNRTKSDMDPQIQKIRNAVRSFYQVQKLRIATGNRICASFRLQMLEVESSDNAYMTNNDNLWSDKTKKKIAKIKKDLADGKIDEEEAEKKIAEAKRNENNGLLGKLKDEYNRLTDWMVDNSATIKSALVKNKDLKLIKTKTDYELMTSYTKLRESEDLLKKVVEDAVKTHPLVPAFFDTVAGCGPLMSAVCLAYFKPECAKYESSFVRYAGLDPVLVERKKLLGFEGKNDATKHIFSKTETEWVTKARDRTVVLTRIDDDGKKQSGLYYNVELHDMLLGRLGPSIIKSASLSKDEYSTRYAKIYYDYKNRLANDPSKSYYSPAHINKAAIRYSMVCFVKDLWKAWRKLEKMPTPEPYYVAKLGMVQHGVDPI